MTTNFWVKEEKNEVFCIIKTRTSSGTIISKYLLPNLMDTELIKREIVYRTARSGGKGGQNVNKVETKVEARFEVAASAALSEEEKALILEKLENQISAEGILSAVNQTERSQLANKELAEEKLLAILQKALHRPKKRKPTAVPAGAMAARTDAKKRLSEKKSTRRRLLAGDIHKD